MASEYLSFIWRDIFWWWVKIFVGPPLRWFFHVQSTGKKHFPSQGQAAFLLANHTHFLDPFMIADFIPRPIRYVVSDEYFRYRITRMLLNWLKGIPKTKDVPDSVTMRKLLAAIKRGEIVGIFPEGRRNWDGETVPLEDTIPRLIQRFKIPVICVRQRGSYLSWPRWSNVPRRRRIIFEFRYLFENPDDVPDDASRIKRMIEKELLYSELDDEEVTKHVFDHPRVAERLELRLWICPHCRRFFALRSERRILWCKHCGARWEFRGNGTFKLEKAGTSSIQDARNFERYIDWVHWNDAETLIILKRLREKGTKELLSLPASMWSTSTETLRDRHYRYKGRGIAVLTSDSRLRFRRYRSRKSDIILDIPLSETTGANVVWNHKFEFYINGMAYRFTFFGQSAYFWHFLTKQAKKDS
ncbi:1-acyl-sn-glycerol-3-phosphate acyltransferase [candidate division WOR-3 bacterium]|nr:1-acyl-sn-glycerol-3-phosphate acyltransferase [candidate division WOR-3 bacterium]